MFTRQWRSHTVIVCELSSVRARVCVCSIEFAIQFVNDFTFNCKFSMLRMREEKKQFNWKSIKIQIMPFELDMRCFAFVVVLLKKFNSIGIPERETEMEAPFVVHL